MLIEGRNAVEQILNSDATIEKIYIQRDMQSRDLINKIKNSGHPYQFMEKTAMDRISKQKNHQGFMAIATQFKYHSLEDILKKARPEPLILILDGVEDPHNFGNIIRTAECMGVDGIIIPKNRAVQVTDTVIRVSAGAASHMKIYKATNINQEIEKLKEKGFWIYAAVMGGVNVANTNMKGPVAIVMGGENTGVKHLTTKLCDATISIPMTGKTTSLNVGNATAMILYEINRQRTKK